MIFKKIFLGLFSLFLLCLGIFLFTKQETIYESKANKIQMNESRKEISNEEISNDEETNYFKLIETNIEYDKINFYYPASNSFLSATYLKDGKEVKLELTIKADESFFLYQKDEYDKAYEGTYKIKDDTLYFKLEKIYNSNICYNKITNIYKFDIIKRNGRKIIEIESNNFKLNEVNKKELTITNSNYSNKEIINKCI